MRWAVVEVMGHRRYAGQVEEVTVAGVPMLRVHVPPYTSTSRASESRLPDGTACPSWDERAVEWIAPVSVLYPGFTVDLGGAALFAVTGCSEERARAALPHSHHGEEEPVRTVGEWTLRSRTMLSGPVEDAEVVDEVERDVDPDDYHDFVDDTSDDNCCAVCGEDRSYWVHRDPAEEE
jgi:hypothetical protein